MINDETKKIKHELNKKKKKEQNQTNLLNLS